MWANLRSSKSVLLSLAASFITGACLHAELKIIKDREFISSLPGSPTALVVKKMNGNSVEARVDKTNLIQVIQSGNIVYLASTSVTNTGSVIVTLKSGKDTLSFILPVVIPASDSDGDGYPDVTEMGDNSSAGASFREWFCVIAESQFFKPSDVWYDVHKDCAGLIEFSFREALKKHDKAWAKNYKYLTDFNIDDTRGYYYPNVPFLGKRVFRITDGPFDPNQVQRDYSAAANGSAIRLHCMKFVSRNVQDARKGDILFFFHDDNLKMPSHAMIYVNDRGSIDPLDGYLIYHTGPGDNSQGIIKKVLLRDLLRHPDPSWRPSSGNGGFLGVYRWKILK